MARPLALMAAIAIALLAVSRAGEAGTQQTPKRGGTLSYRLIGPEPACLNILSARCFNSGTVVDAVLAKPLELGPDFTYRRGLATASYTRTRPFTLTYRIQPRAIWSDGKPVTARDFIFTLRAIRAYGPPDLRELHSVVRSIRAVDAKTVKVVLKPRTSVWRELFGYVLPEHVLRGNDLTKVWDTGIDDPTTGEPIGSGPFLVERFDRGRQIVLRRNPRYWGPHTSYLDRIVVTFIPEASDPTDALRDGELDVATGIPPDRFPKVRREPGIRVSSTATANFEHLDLNVRLGSALRNKLVRRALAYGIDRVALVRQNYGEILPTLQPLDSAVLSPQSPGYGAAWSSYRYRPARARALLEQAGCRRGNDGIYSCGGARLSLRLVTSAGSPSRAQALSLIQEQLRPAGIEALTPVFATPPALFSPGGILDRGDFDLALFSWSFAPGESWSSVYGCKASSNFTGYCQRLVTASLDEAGRILDAEQQARVLNRADRQLARDVPTLPLYQFVVNAARTSAVRNYELYAGNLFWNAENWWLAR